MFLGTRDGFELVVRCGRSLGFGETAIRNFSGLGDEANGRVGIRPFGGRSPLLYDATKPPGVQRRCNSAIRASGACGLKPLNGVSNRIFVKGRLGSSLSPSATLSIRSMGLGMLPIGSVGMMTDVGLATFTSFQSRCAVEEQHKRVLWPGERAEEPLGNQLEATLRILRRKVWNGRLFRRHGYTTPIFILVAVGIFQIFRTTAVKGGRLATESSRTTGGNANRSSFQVQRLLHLGNSLCLPIAVE
jgi:hypothetical protein